MSESRPFELPPTFIDLAFVLVFVWILIALALASEAKKQYATSVDLPKQPSVGVEEKGNEVMSLAITEHNGKPRFNLESIKTGMNKEFSEIPVLSKELERLNPTELMLRVDKETPFRIPLEIMIECNKLEILVMFAYEGV